MHVEGRNAVIELLKSKRKVRKVYVQEGINRDEKIHEIIQRSRNRKIFIDNISRKKLDSLSLTGTHQGVIALSEFEFHKLNEVLENNQIHKLETNLVYIREAVYEHNLGAIARSVEACGYTGLVISPKDEVSPQAMRTSTGALNNLKVIKDGLFPTIKTCKESGMQIIGIEVYTDDHYFDIDLTPDTLFIIGGEDKPLTPEILERCDAVVKVPMRGKINSLNMSVACSIVLFEKLRQLQTRS